MKRINKWSKTIFVVVFFVCRTANAQVENELPSKAEIENRINQLAASNVEEADKASARSQFEQALSDLEKISSLRADIQTFEKQISSAATDLAEAKKELGGANEETQEIEFPADATLLENEQALNKLQQRLATKTENLAKFDAEPKRRAARLEAIPGLTKKVEEELAKVEKTLSTSPEANDTNAARTAAIVRKELLNLTLAGLKKERAAYEATTELLQVQRDVASAEFSHVDAETKRWQELVNDQRQRESKAQDDAARRAAIRAKPPLAALAKQIKELTARRTDIAEKIKDYSDDLEASRELLSDTSKLFERAKEKVEAVGLSHSSGQILRAERATLPDLRQYRRKIKSRETIRQESRFAQYELQDRRIELADIDKSTAALAEELGESTDVMEYEIRELLQLKKDSLEGLISSYDTYAKTLLDLNEIEGQLIDVTEKYSDFISERVLWIRSTFVLNYRDLSPAKDAMIWLFSRANWYDVLVSIKPKNGLQTFIILLLGTFVAILSYSQRQIRKLLTSIGESVSRRGYSQFPPTLRALFLTVVAAITWPIVAWILSLMLLNSGSDFVRALANSILRTSFVWFPLEFMRQAVRPKGLAECHLLWAPTMLAVVRKKLQWLMVVGLPLFLFSSIFDFQILEQLWRTSVGRVGFIAFLLVVSIAIFRMLFAKSGIVDQLTLSRPLPKNVHVIWSVVLVMIPAVLAALAAVGFYETSKTLGTRLFQTAGWLLSVMLAHALFARWVMMRRRRLTIDQMRQRREADAETAESDSNSASNQDASEDVDLATVSEQTVALLRAFAIVGAFVGGWLIWDDIIPALSVLNTYPVFPGMTSVSLAAALMVVVILVVTFMATKNVPGLIELTLLNYLPVDAGARYATKTVCRYAIAAIGFSMAGYCLGITWDSIQWLVAAMGIGLGFGLQEIFVNFISGVILLFERPIRIGDTISIGETTGVVSRIRMRATTVTDFDLKEFIVPNKDLITGRLLNWTLSEQTIRIVINVGVAYGSDTEKARSLLLQVAARHPSVLSKPEPVAIFESFGDSTLNLTLRCYISDIDSRMPTISELHSAIDDEFKRAKIEIAFPQCDIHIRTPQPSAKAVSDENAEKLVSDDELKRA